MLDILTKAVSWTSLLQDMGYFGNAPCHASLAQRYGIIMFTMNAPRQQSYFVPGPSLYLNVLAKLLIRSGPRARGSRQFMIKPALSVSCMRVLDLNCVKQAE